MAEIYVLDVGHGNSTVFISEEGVAVVDAPTGGVLIDFLRERNISRLDLVFVSHADYDHLAGIIAILGSREIAVARIVVGPDAGKPSRAWKNFSLLLREERITTGLVVDTSLNQAQPGAIQQGRARFEVAYPSEVEALSPPGSIIDGHRVSSNDASAVIRLHFDGQPVALLCGDISGWAVLRIAKLGLDLSAPILVFPHHGGSMSPFSAIDVLLDMCDPRYVAFSFGRTAYGHPDPRIVAKVRSRGAYVACTQLSIHCLPVLDSASPKPTIDLLSGGADDGLCCAGTMSFTLPLTELDTLQQHSAFVDLIGSTALCRQ